MHAEEANPERGTNETWKGSESPEVRKTVCVEGRGQEILSVLCGGETDVLCGKHLEDREKGRAVDTGRKGELSIRPRQTLGENGEVSPHFPG